MKQGQFFCIPERPGDVDSLRRQASPLDSVTRPQWLDEADTEHYRYAGRRSCVSSGDADYDQLRAEIVQLEMAGLVVDRDAENPSIWHLYIRSVGDYDIWSIGIYTGNSPRVLRPAPAITNPVLTRDDVTDVAAVFVADPFMVRASGCWFMFFELLNWRANKGEIGLATSRDGLSWKYERRVLVEPFHLSYPYVFRDDNEYYMIPETRQTGSVRLYRATDFPDNWVFVDTLLDRADLVDASVFHRDGRWWMLVCATMGQHHDTLRLFSARSIVGPWEEHTASPVVARDPHRARPAGRVVVEDGRMFRFAQNCHPAYGLDVRAFEITQLTKTGYQEAEVGHGTILGPSGTGWNASGMHHLDAHQLNDGSWIACVDGWMASTM